MAWNKHASSRNRPKNRRFGDKITEFADTPVHREVHAGWGPATELALFRLGKGSNKTERKFVLMKTADLVDSVRTHKNAFRHADTRIAKVQQSRYERRKIRVYLRLGDWLAEA